MIALLLLIGCGGETKVGVDEEVYYRGYKIPPAFLSRQELDQKSSGELFPSNGQTLREFIDEIGIDFDSSGSALITGLSYSGFGMRNTEENHQILVDHLDQRFPDEWSYGDGDKSDQIRP